MGRKSRGGANGHSFIRVPSRRPQAEHPEAQRTRLTPSPDDHLAARPGSAAARVQPAPPRPAPGLARRRCGAATVLMEPPSEGGPRGRLRRGADQAGELPHLASQLRHARPGSRLRRPHRAGGAGPPRRLHDDDLYSHPPARRLRRHPTGPAITRRGSRRPSRRPARDAASLPKRKARRSGTPRGPSDTEVDRVPAVHSVAPGGGPAPIPIPPRGPEEARRGSRCEDFAEVGSVVVAAVDDGLGRGAAPPARGDRSSTSAALRGRGATAPGRGGARASGGWASGRSRTAPSAGAAGPIPFRMADI